MAGAQEALAPPLPVAEINPPEIEATRQQLINALFALANNQPDFHRGIRDDVWFRLGDGARVDDMDNPGRIDAVEYSFWAHRARRPGSRTGVQFEFALTNSLSHVPLSPYDGFEAADTTEEDEEETSQESCADTSFTHQAEIRFKINTDDRDLIITETYTYVDEEGDLVGQTSSETVEPEDDMPTFSEVERLFANPLEFVAEDETGDFQSTLAGIEEGLMQEDRAYDELNIAMAYGVLARIKRAMLLQAGVRGVGRISLRDVLSIK